MIQETKRKVVELPDRKEISLCEAVTAMIYGKAHDVKEEHRRHEEYLGKIELLNHCWGSTNRRQQTNKSLLTNSLQLTSKPLS